VLVTLKLVPGVSGGGTVAIFRRGSGHGPGEDGGRSIGLKSGLNSALNSRLTFSRRGKELRLCERDVDVFEEGLGGDPAYAVRGLDEVVAGPAGLFAAESVGKNERFGKLTSAHQKTGAVDGPLAFDIHSAFFHPTRYVFLDVPERGLRSAECLFQVERLYAQKEGGSIP
jgi:hypothetical protein